MTGAHGLRGCAGVPLGEGGPCLRETAARGSLGRPCPWVPTHCWSPALAPLHACKVWQRGHGGRPGHSSDLVAWQPWQAGPVHSATEAPPGAQQPQAHTEPPCRAPLSGLAGCARASLQRPRRG
jgi:hypothetical protein